MARGLPNGRADGVTESGPKDTWKSSEEGQPKVARIDDFIRTNAKLQRLPFVAELQLLLARDSHEIFAENERAFQDDPSRMPPYWAFAWPGGQALARYLLDHPSIVASRRVADIGSGSGIVAIAAAKAGARHVTAADIDPAAAHVIALNAERNGVSDRVTATTEDLLAMLPDADLIVISDLVYEPELHVRVSAFLDRAMAAGIEVLMGDRLTANRPALPLRELASYDVALVPPLSDQEVRGGRVWRLGRHGAQARFVNRSGGKP